MPSIIILPEAPTADFLVELKESGFDTSIISSSPVSERPAGKPQYWRTTAPLPGNVLYHPTLNASDASKQVQDDAYWNHNQKIQVIGVDMSIADCHIAWHGEKEFDRVDPDAKTLAEIRQR